MKESSSDKKSNLLLPKGHRAPLTLDDMLDT